MIVIKEKNLVANSKRSARYSIKLIALAEGYVVEALHGCSGKNLSGETYWRKSREEADKLYDKFIKMKSKPGRDRVYIPELIPRHDQLRQISEYDQPSLFS